MEHTIPIITIGREYGSGGHEIGKSIANSLSIPFYDNELIIRASKYSGLCKDIIDANDEKSSFSETFMSLGSTSMGRDLNLASSPFQLPLNQKIFLVQFETITEIAHEGPCVIVGRCADYVLHNFRNVFNVFFYGNLENRIQRIMQINNISYNKAKETIKKMDKQRKQYYNFFANGNWGQCHNYDALLCTSYISTDKIAQQVIALSATKQYNS